MKCQFEGCNKKATFSVEFKDEKDKINNGNYCTKHKKDLCPRCWYDKVIPINYKKFNIEEGWINADENILPDNFRSIEISDGKIVDTGYILGCNWYFYNYYEQINDKPRYWRYI